MQIVIEFPDIKYQWIKENPLTYNSEYCEAIRNGVPLPKGHGRLIDVDDLDITTITTDDYSGNEVLDIVLKEDVDDAPTIIEADKAGDEE
jgi:hypothetical protein